MARDGMVEACQYRRTAAERQRSRKWAALSADNAIRHLNEQLLQAKEKYARVEDAFQKLMGNAELADRIRAALPALTALLQGNQPSRVDKLRRNVAVHAEAAGLRITTATPKQLRSAQHGPRLEQRLACASPLNPNAAEFFPGILWEESNVMNGMQHGQGTYVDAKGRNYMDEVMTGMQHGQGTYVDAKGHNHTEAISRENPDTDALALIHMPGTLDAPAAIEEAVTRADGASGGCESSPKNATSVVRDAAGTEDTTAAIEDGRRGGCQKLPSTGSDGGMLSDRHRGCDGCQPPTPQVSMGNCAGKAVTAGAVSCKSNNSSRTIALWWRRQRFRYRCLVRCFVTGVIAGRCKESQFDTNDLIADYMEGVEHLLDDETGMLRSWERAQRALDTAVAMVPLQL